MDDWTTHRPPFALGPRTHGTERSPKSASMPSAPPGQITTSVIEIPSCVKDRFQQERFPTFIVFIEQPGSLRGFSLIPDAGPPQPTARRGLGVPVAVLSATGHAVGARGRRGPPGPGPGPPSFLLDSRRRSARYSTPTQEWPTRAMAMVARGGWPGVPPRYGEAADRIGRGPTKINFLDL